MSNSARRSASSRLSSAASPPRTWLVRGLPSEAYRLLKVESELWESMEMPASISDMLMAMKQTDRCFPSIERSTGTAMMTCFSAPSRLSTDISAPVSVR